jgi:hypothetical protein
VQGDAAEQLQPGLIMGGQTKVSWAIAPENGTYTIVILPQGGTTYKKATGVSYPGSVAFSAFVDLPLN